MMSTMASDDHQAVACHSAAGATVADAVANPLGAVPPDLRPRFVRGGVWSDALSAFAGEGAAVDPIGLATVLTFGYALGTRTVLRGVETDRVDPEGFPARHAPSDGDLLELTLEAVRRHVGAPRWGAERPTVLLSGGRDSRLILLAMRRLGIRPRCILTLDQAGSGSDAAIAERLASAVGERVERVHPLAFDGAHELERHVAQGFQSLEHAWFVAIARRVRVLSGPVTDGIGAGVLSTGSLLHPEAIALWNACDLSGLGAWTAAHGGHVSPRFLAAARAEGVPLAARDQVEAEFAAAMRSLASTPNPLGMYSLLHWSRRGIGASAYGLLPRDRVVTPLYDRELCAAIAAMPMDRAMSRDWREIVLGQLDDTGVPFSVAEGGMLPRWMRHPWRTIRSRGGWARFVRGLPEPLARLARVADEGTGMRRTFDRGAVGLLAALDGAVGFTRR